jgi:hypothetical protein
MASQVDIANMALAKFGSAPIQSFDDATPAGRAVALLYPLVMNSLMGEYPWSFCKQTVALAQLNVADLADGMNIAGWLNAFALPGAMLANPSRLLANARYPDNPLTDYEIQGSTVFCNQIAVWAVGEFYLDEANWPPTFQKAAVDVFAAEIYPTITGNGGQLASLKADAWGAPQEQRQGGSLGMAKRADARNQPSRRLPNNPLIDVRQATISVIPSGLSS